MRESKHAPANESAGKTEGWVQSAKGIRVGCAGWSLPSEHKPLFQEIGSHLERYATVFPAVEINSSFYRCHRKSTYARWAQTVPDDFRFAVKMSKDITHDSRLRLPSLLDEFLAGPVQLGDKLGPLLVQLPPSLGLEMSLADSFFDALRERFDGLVVCEPRHPSWFSMEGDGLLESYQIARVAADPSPAPGAGRPGGWRGMTYFRLHGSPRMYYSEYDDDFLTATARHLVGEGAPIWCIFDNTARNGAIPNALRMMELICSAFRGRDLS